jgi:hypothetical protein
MTTFVCLALATACSSTLTSGSVPEPSGSSVPKSGAAHLVVLSDPGQVTYSVHPANCHTTGSGTQILQDPSCTPGGIDPKVTQSNLASTICKSGYTSTVRPPSSQTGKAKRAQYVAYGVPDGTTSELDHLVSLELGGNNDIANLWPEIGKLPNSKDKVENDLHRAVCSGKVKLADAQRAIATDWRTAEHQFALA